MNRPMKTDAIKAFLNAKTYPDLASMYNHDMEVQVTVAQDGGERIDGEYMGKHWQGYTDGLQTWKPIRIPRNADTEPVYEDSPVGFSLPEHAEGIGMTGWDWVNRVSRWVAFDFDAIMGHSEKHSKRLDDHALETIRSAVSNLSYVTVRTSTGGSGLHLYVHLSSDGFPTANHTEHASVARAILSKMSAEAGFDFTAHVDVCGGNMWVWHRKLVLGTGLKLLKAGVPLDNVPANWRDYASVISRKRDRNLPRFIEDQSSTVVDEFEQVCGQRYKVPLDDVHKRIMAWIDENYPSSMWWDAEHHMMVTHTYVLKQCHTALALKGGFETMAQGTEKNCDHNCFLYPLAGGAWSVMRYTPGVAEHPYWSQDGRKWTSTFFNREMTLQQVASIFSAVEDADGSYVFPETDTAQRAATLLNITLDLPVWASGRQVTMKAHKQSGKIIVTVPRTKADAKDPKWVEKSNKMVRVLNVATPEESIDELNEIDHYVRHLVDANGNGADWTLLSATKNWHIENLTNVKLYLGSTERSPAEITTDLGRCVANPWFLVSKPFQPEFPGERQWNRTSAKLKFVPSPNRDSLKFPTWQSILSHLGSNLDGPVSTNEWCKKVGILTGADWLKCWVAALFQKPTEPLPYLFLYSDRQNTGKSTLHDALSLLMTQGVCRADAALISGAGFNSELEGCVLAVIEETDLRKNTVAANRIKDWVTSRQLPIHRKGKEPYTIANTIHFIQCSNTHLACPVFPGDTRITYIRVSEMDKSKQMPPHELFQLLEAEAPDFLAEILALQIPKSNDRLYLPCLRTDDKIATEESNRSTLEVFLQDKCYAVPGHKIKFSDFYEKFIEWLEPQEVSYWSSKRVGMEWPIGRFPKGRSTTNASIWVANITFDKNAVPSVPYFVRNEYLYQDDSATREDKGSDNATEQQS